MSGAPMAVLLSRFPLVTETFILREVIELERQGRPVRLVPILHERPEVVHREALPWMGRVLYAPLFSAAVAAASLRVLRQRPGQVLRLFGRLAMASAGSPGFFVKTLALFPKSLWIAERLEAEGAAHLHAHFATHPATLALIVSSLTGIPWSVTVHAHDIFVSRVLLREKLAAARFVRAISRFNRDYLERLYPELQGRVRVIHAGIDPAVYRRLPPPPQRRGRIPRILCVASLRPYKGHAVLLEACRLLRDQGITFRCELVGDGPLRPELERRIAELGLQDVVRLFGALPQNQVARRLGRSSVFVLPSVVAPDGQMEGIPVALMEAMAAGRPVVASDLSGIPELVQDGVSGFLTRPGDAAGIAAAVKRLIGDPCLGRTVGERGRDKVEREFRLDGTVADLLGEVEPHAAPGDPEAEALLTRAGLPGAGVRRVHRRADSMVIEALAPGPLDLVVKVQRSRPGESRPPQERARHEHEVLDRLQGLFAEEPGFGVPRPLRLLEEEAAMVMERCEGAGLDELIRRGRSASGPEWKALAVAVRRAGRWLRLFQRHTAASGDPGPALAALLARAAADLAACRKSLRLPRDLEARLERLAGRIGPAGWVGHHGDFWPGNLCVDEKQVQVLDFEGFREGLPWEDAAYFLVHLEPFFAWPGLQGRGEKAAAAFLEGWLEGDALDRSALDLCLLAKALQVLARSPGGWRQRRALVSILKRVGT
jgi:glycosyltransferase involved in cell wall biosynthesis/aminoglycoside phosphotransferase (APT) family kinase protein